MENQFSDYRYGALNILYDIESVNTFELKGVIERYPILLGCTAAKLEEEFVHLGNLKCVDIRRDPVAGAIIATYSILPLGRKIFEAERERREKDVRRAELEHRKLEIDVELGEKVVRDYPSTRRAARISLAIAVLLLLFEFYKMMTQKS